MDTTEKSEEEAVQQGNDRLRSVSLTIVSVLSEHNLNPVEAVGVLEILKHQIVESNNGDD